MALEEQTKAVFKSSRTDEDPVSGNEVPTGSLPEEVRDDIPAQLSEGEYVVPADVVRYYGVKFFEDLRSEAKAGWQGMEQNGRIGGEPVSPEGMEMVEPEDADFPFDISELQTVEAFEGAYVSGYAEGGEVDRNTPMSISKKETIDYTGGMGSGSSYFDVRKYVNKDGQVQYITFMNGQPINVIPEGFYPEGQLPEEDITETAATVSGGDDNEGPDVGGGSDADPTNWYDKYDLKSKEGITAAVDDLTSEGNDFVSAGVNMLFGPLGSVAEGLVNANKIAKARGIVEQVKQTDAELAAELEAKINARLEDTRVASAMESISPTLIDGSTYAEELGGLVTTAGETTQPETDSGGSKPPVVDPVVEQTQAVLNAGEKDEVQNAAEQEKVEPEKVELKASSDNKSGESGIQMHKRLQAEAAERKAKVEADVSSVQQQMDETGKTAAQVGREMAPSTAKTSNVGSGSGGTATMSDSVSAKDESDPRNMNKGD